MPVIPDAIRDAVTRIVSEIGGQGWQGSGVLISPDEVLTANHVSFMQGTVNGLATSIDVKPGYDSGNAPLGDYSGSVAHYFTMDNNPGITLGDIQSDYSIIHLDAPVIGGSVVRLVPDFMGGSVHVTGYPANGHLAMTDLAQTISTDPSYSIYEGQALSPGFSGSPVWAMGADGIVNDYGVVSATTADTSYDVKFTAAEVAQIAAWVKADDVGLNPPPPPHAVAVLEHDVSTGQDVADTSSTAYSGAVDYLKTQFIDLSPHNLNITAVVPNVFIHTGAGNDAVALMSGRNVVDGGAGSNFLTGGTGTDTFFVDARAIASDVWSTVNSFHSGDAATLFGITQGAQTLNWLDGDGAVGAKGLTLHATAAGKPTASLTLAGFSMADMANGKITTSFGHTDGGDYLYVHAA